ncbi:COG5452 Uncharacterized conserved protein [Rhabdaerophilaceae bacterium]
MPNPAQKNNCPLKNNCPSAKSGTSDVPVADNGDLMVHLPFFSPKPDRVGLLLADIAEASRNPVAYRELGVADTFEGRFERLALVTTLVLRQLGTRPAPADSVSQELVDAVMAHLDDGLRRSGVGDLSVGKKMKMLAQSFYGRAKAYTDALDEGSREGLCDALSRNLYSSVVPPSDVSPRLIAEIGSLETALAAASLDEILSNKVLAKASKDALTGQGAAP